MKKVVQNNAQELLFSEQYCDQLQDIVKDRYREAFEKQPLIFAPDEPEETVVELPTKKFVLAPPLIPDAEINKCKEISDAERKRLHRQKVLEARKTMDLKYYPNPKNENELLFNYQYEFIKNENQEAWGKILELATLVLKKLIRCWLRETRSVFWDEITQEEKASEALLYVLHRYDDNIGWFVSTNWITVLGDGVRHVTEYENKITRATIYVEDVNLAKCKNQKKE